MPDDIVDRSHDSLLSRRQVLKGGVIGAAGAVAFRPPWRSGSSDPRADLDSTGTRAAGNPIAEQAETQAAASAPQALTVDGLAAPIGLSANDIHFAWQVNDLRRGAVQAAYRIVVTKPALAGSSKGTVDTVWDTGRVGSSTQSFVPYGGPLLASDTPYQWTVQTWGQDGTPSPLAPAGTFETGLQDGDWHASWIGRPADVAIEPDQYTYARKAFTLGPSTIVRARAYVSGDQQYEMYLNGVRVGKGQAYSYPDAMYYETLDVTTALQAGGQNAAGLLYNWQGPTKGHPAGVPGVIAQISVHHEDGSSELITTDGSWNVLAGAWLAGTERDIEGDLVDYTENIDGPAIPVGWDTPTFDDSHWQPATVAGPAGTKPWTSLVSVRTRISETPVNAVSVTTLASGAIVADFGKVYAAVPTVTFHNGVAGRLINMRAGYLLDGQPGRFYVGEPGQVSIQHGTQHTNMSYSYIQRGGAETFHPFDFLGFRYFQVDDPGEELTAGDFVALTRHTIVPDENAATFSCSNTTINDIFALSRHSALFTAQEQFIDTPTREKGPWLWDGYNESQTTMAAFGEQNLTRKSLLEFAQSQARYWPSGAVNKIYPTGLGAEDINEYTEIYPEWVWQYWMNTGDSALLEAVFPALKNVAEYVNRAIVASTGLVTNLPSTEMPDYSFPVVTRINVLGYNVFRRVADIATVLGRPKSEVSEQRRRQRSLLAAINSTLTRADGIYVDGLESGGSQTSSATQDPNACALTYSIVPAQFRKAVAQHVASLGMSVEPQTALDVLRALADNGREVDVIAVLTDTTNNGWANILVRGATFTWEVWQPSDINGDSMSHGWGSNVLIALQQVLLGVRPTSPGFATFDVTPPSTVLEWSQGTVPTPRGTIGVSWQRPTAASTRYELAVTVPANATATLHVPVAPSGSMTESGVPIDRASGVGVVAIGARRTVLRVGAGSYHFVHNSGAA